jgi:DNA-nicking Smr family endonuclease
MDAAVLRQLKRGEYPISVRLDLHGMRCDAAHDALRETLENAYHDGARCLLIITGKGREGAGVLREALPLWLEDAKRFVLAYDVAQPKHGGSGAFYVLVRRKRALGKGMEERSDD